MRYWPSLRRLDVSKVVTSAGRVSDCQHSPVRGDRRREDLRHPRCRPRNRSRRAGCEAAPQASCRASWAFPRARPLCAPGRSARSRRSSVRASAPRRWASAVRAVSRAAFRWYERQDACGDARRRAPAPRAREQDPQPAVAPSRDLELVELRVAAGAQELALQLVELAVVRACDHSLAPARRVPR